MLALSLAACSSEADAPSADGPPAAPVGATLLASVGTQDDPEAFEIALTTEDGQEVDSLAAGEYTIVINDYAQIHNFHLSGPGVDEETSVPETGETSVTVTFGAGEYDYVCDPHPSMSGSFVVSG